MTDIFYAFMTLISYII